MPVNDNLVEQSKNIFKNYIAINVSTNNYLLTDLFDIKYGKGLSSSDLLNSGYFVFGSNGLIGYYNSYMYENEQITISCRGASSGKVNISLPKSYITSNSLILECKNQQYYEFLKQFCKNYNFEEYVTGSAQPQLTIDSLVNISVLLPKLEETTDICSILSILSNKITENKLEILNLENNKDLILNCILKNYN